MTIVLKAELTFIASKAISDMRSDSLYIYVSHLPH